MKYSAVGLSSFIKRLKFQLDMRIDMFVKQKNKEIVSMGENEIKTEQEWINEYLRWSRNISPVQKSILRYMTTENDDAG